MGGQLSAVRQRAGTAVAAVGQRDLPPEFSHPHAQKSEEMSLRTRIIFMPPPARAKYAKQTSASVWLFLDGFGKTVPGVGMKIRGKISAATQPRGAERQIVFTTDAVVRLAQRSRHSPVFASRMVGSFPHTSDRFSLPAESPSHTAGSFTGLAEAFSHTVGSPSQTADAFIHTAGTFKGRLRLATTQF